MRIEHSRRHGPFDPRYPPTSHKPARASLWRLGEDRLDWQGFLARFFPGSRRHDLDALEAYESYIKDVEGRPAGDAPPAALSSASSAAQAMGSDIAQDSEGEQESPATAEGGASAARPGRRRRGERAVGIQKV